MEGREVEGEMWWGLEGRAREAGAGPSKAGNADKTRRNRGEAFKKTPSGRVTTIARLLRIPFRK